MKMSYLIEKDFTMDFSDEASLRQLAEWELSEEANQNDKNKRRCKPVLLT
ncbi:hypothetical protein BofuT4_uP127600.1 [Botrytis cinerea T4]|uniref:Uncharacterized protein n=1 Tax=Botryotinia fuckeliana (strain T4) TaxID=999810 RepID=G2YSW4_BOTF4|nr:hypothetical protein BofuT4_uP127600.1 [Botrytis cinerea T4]